MSRQAERAKENRQKRESALRELEDAILYKQENWMTKERAKAVALTCVAIGAGIFGFLKASGAFSLPSP